MGRWKDLAEDAKAKQFDELVAGGMTEDDAIETMREEEEAQDRDPN